MSDELDVPTMPLLFPLSYQGPRPRLSVPRATDAAAKRGGPAEAVALHAAGTAQCASPALRPRDRIITVDTHPL
jgi:hypothetical protein